MKNECSNCRDDLITIVPIITEDVFEVCSNWCKDDWEADTRN